MQMYCVGTTTFSLVDENRKEVIGSKEGNRKIAVRLFYPVDPQAVEGKEKAKLFSPRMLETLKKVFRLKNMDESLNEADYYDDILPIDGEKFPVVFFSHGYQGYLEQNSRLCTALARGGYVVASVGHNFEGMLMEFEDGSATFYDKSLNKQLVKPMIPAFLAQNKLLKKKLSPEDAEKAFRIFENKYSKLGAMRLTEWVKDTECVLRALEHKNADKNDRFHDYFDFSNGVGVTGHSFGGATAYHLCMYNPAFSCGVNMDGALFGGFGEDILEKPFLTMGCLENRNVESRALLYHKTRTYYYGFPDMKHMGFTDAKMFFKIPKYVGSLDANVADQAIRESHLAFFGYFLKKDNVLTLEEAEGLFGKNEAGFVYEKHD